MAKSNKQIGNYLTIVIIGAIGIFGIFQVTSDSPIQFGEDLETGITDTGGGGGSSGMVDDTSGTGSFSSGGGGGGGSTVVTFCSCFFYPFATDGTCSNSDASLTQCLDGCISENPGDLRCMFTTPKVQYAIFAVMPDEIKTSVQTRLGPETFVGSFRILALDRFTNNELMLLGFSNATTQQAITDALAKGYSAVAYDNEPQNGMLSTPPEELEEGKPALFTNYLGALTKDAGLKYVVAPTRRLLDEEYLGVDWSLADILIMQLQGHRSVTEYVEQGKRVGEYVASQNPNTIILAQINPNHPACTLPCLDTIQDELTQLKGIVHGVSIICGECTDQQFNDMIDVVEIALGKTGF